MSTKFVKFPPEKEADAIAYEAECTAQLRLLTGEVDGRWYVNPVTGAPGGRPDRNGNWTVALYGPPWVWNVAEVEEPASCALLRADAVVVDFPEWPVEEE